ncbi:MAG: universal stress protein [Porticoccaceae bacterium]|nr:universal stress protein [Pseudomonadales bacterium]MCP5171533.1 universal stress protein [Pseudomonadales bacterium]
MSNYQHILVGLDLSEESRQVIDRVKKLFDLDNVKLSLIHVQEPMSFAYGGDIPMDLGEIQSQMEERAQQSLKSIGKELKVSEDNQHVIIGQPAAEMHRFAKEQDVDLIVVGTHGRHGFSLVLGSTANGVLHGCVCDVLAVRIK